MKIAGRSLTDRVARCFSQFVVILMGVSALLVVFFHARGRAQNLSGFELFITSANKQTRDRLEKRDGRRWGLDGSCVFIRETLVKQTHCPYFDDYLRKIDNSQTPTAWLDDIAQALSAQGLSVFPGGVLIAPGKIGRAMLNREHNIVPLFVIRATTVAGELSIMSSIEVGSWRECSRLNIRGRISSFVYGAQSTGAMHGALLTKVYDKLQQFCQDQYPYSERSATECGTYSD